jgi:hypothetical protein
VIVPTDTLAVWQPTAQDRLSGGGCDLAAQAQRLGAFALPCSRGVATVTVIVVGLRVIISRDPGIFDRCNCANHF